jgi:signal transduction histidine kinase
MWRSLHVRVLTAILLVAIAAVAITMVFASQRTVGEFFAYRRLGLQLEQRRFTILLTQRYSQTQTWEGVQALAEQISLVSGERLIVANNQGKILIDSGQELVGKTAAADWPEPVGRIVHDNAQVGVLYLLPVLEPARLDAIFLSAVNRTVLLGGLIAVVLAVAIALVGSRRIVRPVEQLTSAARRMETGDLSARVRVQRGDEMGELARAFNAMADGLARQEQLRRNLVSDVAHELRTPLTNIRGYLQAAREGVLEPDRALVENLFQEAMLLNRLVDDLHDLAQAEAKQLQLDRQPARADELVLSAIEAFAPRAEERHIALDALVPADLPLVNVDGQRVGQVLRNLLNNALGFTPPGGQIVVTAQAGGAWVNVLVRDTGPGIAPEHLPHVFERFYRADKARARAAGGTGLGLSIVKQLVEAHGGRVWVENASSLDAPGPGATFGFTLPVAGV